MSKYTSEVVESEKAFEYLRYVFHVKEDVYSTKAAESFGVQQPRATKVLSSLEDLGVLKSTKKGRKKVYEYSPEGMYQLFWDLTIAELDPKSSDLEKLTTDVLIEEYGMLKDFSREDKDFETIEEVIDYISSDLRPEFYDFLIFFVRDYFRHVEDSSIKQMYITDFYRGFSEIKEKAEYPTKFRILDTIGKEFETMLERPGPIVQSALMDLEKLKEIEEE